MQNPQISYVTKQADKRLCLTLHWMKNAKASQSESKRLLHTYNMLIFLVPRYFGQKPLYQEKNKHALWY